MKKLLLASAMALVSFAFVTAPTLRAQDLTIQDPAEFNAYQQASTQSAPAAKAAALESFLTAYPQTVVKKVALDSLIDIYLGGNDQDKALSAATRLLQVDPTNMKALFYSVVIKKAICQKGIDPSTGDLKDQQSCDDSAALAQKGLTAPKPAGMTDDAWKTFTANAYPIFHSAIANDDAVSKKDYKSAIDEYNKELMLFSPDACAKAGPCLIDTLQLAQTYAKPGDSRDPIKAIWFYSRAWDFAPPAFKTQIETPLEYWYNRYHGTLDGPAANKSQMDAIKAQAQATLFPPETFKIEPAPTPDKLAHAALVGGDPMKLNLEDKEFILANGTKDDASKLWDLLKDQLTPVPGVVISDPVNSIAISATIGAAVKPTEYTVALAKPMACTDAPAETASVKAKLDFIQANAAPSDAGKIADLVAMEPIKIKKLTVELGASQLKVAVTQDAKDNKNPDFIVNMKQAVGCKDLPAAGFEFKTLPADELDATYDNYSQQPAASATVAPTAQIVLREGFIQAAKRRRLLKRLFAGLQPAPPCIVGRACNRQSASGIKGSSLQRAALFVWLQSLALSGPVALTRPLIQKPVARNAYSPSPIHRA